MFIKSVYTGFGLLIEVTKQSVTLRFRMLMHLSLSSDWRMDFITWAVICVARSCLSYDIFTHLFTYLLIYTHLHISYWYICKVWIFAVNKAWQCIVVVLCESYSACLWYVVWPICIQLIMIYFEGRDCVVIACSLSLNHSRNENLSLKSILIECLYSFMVL